MHKKTVRVCLLITQVEWQLHKEFRTYSTTTEDVLKLWIG